MVTLSAKGGKKKMATLTVTNPNKTVQRYQNLYFSWSGFGVNDTIYIEIYDSNWNLLGGLEVQGASGSSGFNVGDPAGYYHLVATNSGFATDNYTVVEGTPTQNFRGFGVTDYSPA